jgi:hypothetical protein
MQQPDLGSKEIVLWSTQQHPAVIILEFAREILTLIESRQCAQEILTPDLFTMSVIYSKHSLITRPRALRLRDEADTVAADHVRGLRSASTQLRRVDTALLEITYFITTWQLCNFVLRETQQ